MSWVTLIIVPMSGNPPLVSYEPPKFVFKPPAPLGVYSIRVCPSVPSSFSFFFSPLYTASSWPIGLTFSLKLRLRTPIKVSLGQRDPSRIRSESATGSADSDQMLKIFKIFHNFFSQMDTECDVDHKQSFWSLSTMSSWLIVLKFSLKLRLGTPMKVSLGQHDPSRVRSESAIGSDQSVDDGLRAGARSMRFYHLLS